MRGAGITEGPLIRGQFLPRTSFPARRSWHVSVWAVSYGSAPYPSFWRASPSAPTNGGPGRRGRGGAVWPRTPVSPGPDRSPAQQDHESIARRSSAGAPQVGDPTAPAPARTARDGALLCPSPSHPPCLVEVRTGVADGAAPVQPLPMAGARGPAHRRGPRPPRQCRAPSRIDPCPLAPARACPLYI